MLCLLPFCLHNINIMQHFHFNKEKKYDWCDFNPCSAFVPPEWKLYLDIWQCNINRSRASNVIKCHEQQLISCLKGDPFRYTATQSPKKKWRCTVKNDQFIKIFFDPSPFASLNQICFGKLNGFTVMFIQNSYFFWVDVFLLSNSSWSEMSFRK